MGYAQYLRPANVKRNIKQVRSEGILDYNIKPAGPRSEYNSDHLSCAVQRAYLACLRFLYALGTYASQCHGTSAKFWHGIHFGKGHPLTGDGQKCTIGIFNVLALVPKKFT